MKKRIRTALIASGSGTDAYAIMKAREFMPEVEICLLISTKKNAGCLGKAAECLVPSLVVDRRELGAEPFNREIFHIVRDEKIQLVFLVGCIVKIPPMIGVAMYNIHPANIEKYGGKGMYGLEPHKKVLLDIKDQIQRGRKTIDDEFYTEPTVHEAANTYDSGQYLLKAQVQVPKGIVSAFIKGDYSLDAAAEMLQKIVLPHEWMMLPLAVRTAAIRLL